MSNEIKNVIAMNHQWTSGNITRLCGEGGVWHNADNSSCENVAFMNFQAEVSNELVMKNFVA